MNCNHILLAVSILAAATCFVSGHVGPGLVTVASLTAVYLYRYKDQIPSLMSAATARSVKEQAEATGTKGVSKSVVSRQARNHRPGLPPKRDGKILRVLPNSTVPSEEAHFIRRRQVGVFM